MVLSCTFLCQFRLATACPSSHIDVDSGIARPATCCYELRTVDSAPFQRRKMVQSRQIKLLLVTLASCTASGCVAFHTTSPVEMVLAHTESGQPVANQQVSLSYKHHMFQGAPGSITDHTDDRGRVVLHIADVEFDLT